MRDQKLMATIVAAMLLLGCLGCDKDKEQKALNVEESITEAKGARGETVGKDDAMMLIPAGNETTKALPVDKIPKIKIGKDGAEMILIPAGEFQMGGGSCAPVHMVYLDAFYMDKYEVTKGLYKKFLDATGHKAPKFFYIRNEPNYPVINVTWDDAVAYAEWVDKCLPTEAQWEKAARGGLRGKKYPWGDEEVNAGGIDRANYEGVRHPGVDILFTYELTTPVGSYAPNGYGLYDMAGNVRELCADWFDCNYYASSPKNNPTGPDSGTYRVIRGGSYQAWSLDVALRNWIRPFVLRTRDIGFRCVSQGSLPEGQ